MHSYKFPEAAIVGESLKGESSNKTLRIQSNSCLPRLAIIV